MSAVFIHLSDIHFGQEKSGGQIIVNSDARDRLIDDASAVLRELGTSANGIIVTGDIAYSGQQHQYQEAGIWLDKLAKNAGGEIYDIQIVPGNHDIDRKEISNATKWMLEEVAAQGEVMLDKFLDDDKDRELLFSRFKAYRDFAQAYNCPLDCNGGHSSDFLVNLVPGRSIRFIRLNSALACAERDQEGSLILGARQRVIPINPGEETVVLTHHPLNWFQDSEDAKNYIRGRARILISGHEHFPSLVVERVEDGNDLMLLAAGATTPDGSDQDFTYKYNIIKFDWDKENDALAVTLHPRTWNDKLKRFEEDTAFLTGKSATTILSSPNFRASSIPVLQDDIPRINISTAQSKAENTPSLPAYKEKPIEIQVSQERRLQLYFFRDLTEGERLKVLFDLQMIPDNLQEKLNHTMERYLFSELLQQGLGDKLKILVEEILTSREGDNP